MLQLAHLQILRNIELLFHFGKGTLISLVFSVQFCLNQNLGYLQQVHVENMLLANFGLHIIKDRVQRESSLSAKQYNQCEKSNHDPSYLLGLMCRVLWKYLDKQFNFVSWSVFILHYCKTLSGYYHTDIYGSMVCRICCSFHTKAAYWP